MDNFIKEGILQVKTASRFVEETKKQVGKREADSTFKSIIDKYNSYKPLPRGYKVKYTDHWCAVFVSSISITLGYTDIIPLECSCVKLIELFKKLGCWIENENIVPKAGDIIFYDWQDSGQGDNRGNADHVGIVEKVLDKTITVIEGNYSEAVKRRYITVNNRYIRGYARPKYEVEVKKTNEQIAKEVLEGKWGNGTERKRRLTEAGYSYKDVQAEVNRMASNKLKSLEVIAWEVIYGLWGNGDDRRNKLIRAGYDYEIVQNKVNEILTT